MANETEKLLIIGGSDAGISAALKAKELRTCLESFQEYSQEG